MQFQVGTSAAMPQVETTAPVATSENTELLRQILEIQKQQLQMMQAQAAAHDNVSRWRAFLGRWREDFPDLAEACRDILPHLEKSYGSLLDDLTDQLRDNGAPDNEIALQEFLDRFGMRLAQLGTILNLVGPLAEAAPRGES
ncbi:MAG: hypothetical protein AB7K24_23185 [Gemmataceae bacterium]